jgi:hypothetical protein
MQPLDLTNGDNLRAQSMHHFKLNVKDVVKIYRCRELENIHQLFLLLLNHVAELEGDSFKEKEEVMTNIIAPKPFMNCLYKECSVIFKGKVIT